MAVSQIPQFRHYVINNCVIDDCVIDDCGMDLIIRTESLKRISKAIVGRID
jgi:hypothetical protein